MNGHRCPSIPQGERLSVQFAKFSLRKLLGYATSGNGTGASLNHANVLSNSSATAFLPFSSRKRVPVPVK